MLLRLAAQLAAQTLLHLLSLVHCRYIFARDPCFFSRIVNIKRKPKDWYARMSLGFYFLVQKDKGNQSK